MQARVIAVGVGPGDPELLTLKGARLIREADVVVTPVSDPGKSSIARSIIEGLLDPQRQQLVTQVFPMRRDQSGLEEDWVRSAHEVAGFVQQGKTVAFVTIGDPFLYSTFLYLYHQLQKFHPAIEVEIVSGVSSINTAAALAGLPLGLSDERLAVLPATYEEQKLVQTLEQFDTIVLMKVHRVFGRIRTLLAELGLKEQAVYVKRVGLPGEAVFHDLDQVGEEDLNYLSMVIVKK
ncbi:precorrin-2 C(20)-methyltransferase [Desulfuromonas versatilis]|uniref:Precorrin-2 C(20)-methyltransferase n=1 Tax=Desulfuromonas versatilis TaxID=2802975 RepID=A0ABN6DUM4_9BACT|nr:precorrin-2 C(20)-methyltransferase [Desulfuromonas versatilis]BCR03745.1 precorrin-2 C(20)-methyltransferase [Desulfuromonas versatilis]